MEIAIGILLILAAIFLVVAVLAGATGVGGASRRMIPILMASSAKENVISSAPSRNSITV